MIKRLAVIALAALAACSTAPQQNQQKDAPPASGGTRFRYLPDENLFPVGAIPEATLHDTKRNKDLGITIEYPTRGGPFPVIIFSHGYGSSKEAYTALTEYWAGHGYVCIKPSHADAGALKPILAKLREDRRADMEKRREESKSRRGRQPADEAPAADEPLAESLWTSLTPADWTNRAADVSLIIDSLGAIEEKYPELAGRMMTSQIGVAGHSLGAFTTMLVAGTADFKTSPPIRIGDPRVKAGLALSPQGLGADQGLTAESWKDVKIPMMYVTGSLDRGAGSHADPKWRHDAFAFSPAGDKFFVSFAGARHSTFVGGVADIDDSEIPVRGMRGDTQTDPWGNQGMMPARGQGGRAAGAFGRDRRVFGQVKTISTAFFDAYLKNEPAGRDYVKPGGALDGLNGSDVTVERK